MAIHLPCESKLMLTVEFFLEMKEGMELNSNSFTGKNLETYDVAQ
jgi:hypothetical protein